MIMKQSSYNIDDVVADNNFKIDVLLMMLHFLKMQATSIRSIYYFFINDAINVVFDIYLINMLSLHGY